MEVSNKRYKELSNILNEKELSRFNPLVHHDVELKFQITNPKGLYTCHVDDLDDEDLVVQNDFYIFKSDYLEGYVVPLVFKNLEDATSFCKALPS